MTNYVHYIVTVIYISILLIENTIKPNLTQKL